MFGLSICTDCVLSRRKKEGINLGSFFSYCFNAYMGKIPQTENSRDLDLPRSSFNGDFPNIKRSNFPLNECLARKENNLLLSNPRIYIYKLFYLLFFLLRSLPALYCDRNDV